MSKMQALINRTKIRNTEIIRLYVEEGKSINVIARRYNFTPNYIRYNVLKNIVPKYEKNIERNAEIVRLYVEDHMSAADIAKIYKITRQGIDYILSKI